MSAYSGTCQSHADVHAFSSDCIGWRDQPGTYPPGHPDEGLDFDGLWAADSAYINASMQGATPAKCMRAALRAYLSVASDASGSRPAPDLAAPQEATQSATAPEEGR